MICDEEDRSEVLVEKLIRKFVDLASSKKYERNDPRLKITKPELSPVLCQK